MSGENKVIKLGNKLIQAGRNLTIEQSENKEKFIINAEGIGFFNMYIDLYGNLIARTLERKPTRSPLRIDGNGNLILTI